MKFECRDDSARSPLQSEPLATPLAPEHELLPHAPAHDWCPAGPGDSSALLPYVDDVAAHPKPDHGLHVSLKDRQIVAGDPNRPQDGYFLASQKEQGARWSTEGGGFTGKIDKNGLDAREVLGAHDQLHEQIKADKSGSLAWEHDGKTEGELYGRYKSGTDYEAGLRRTWDLDGGAHLTTGIRQQGTAAGTLDGVFAGYKSGDGHTTLDGAAGVQGGQFVGNLSGTRQLTPHDTVTGALSHDASGTVGRLGETHTWDGGSLAGNLEIARRPDGTTTTVSGAYQEHGTNVNGSFVHAPNRDALSLSASSQLSPQLSLSGHAGYEHTPAGNQATFGASERYRSGNLSEAVSIDGGVGTRNYLSATGSLDARLGRNLYGSAWGRENLESGQHASSQLGASLTYQPTDKTALTLAGSADDHGRFETRLELDMLKKRIEGAGDLADRRADSPVGLFLSYSKGGMHDQLDGRFGAPQLSGRDGMISGGVRIKF